MDNLKKFDHPIIDFHTHLNDITGLAERKNILLIDGKIPDNLVANLEYNPLFVAFLASSFFPKWMLKSSIVKTANFSHIKNLTDEMERSCVMKSIVLPIEPIVNTEDVLLYCKNINSTIPLFSIDLEHLDIDQIEVEINKKRKLYNFAGVKYHPNIQNTHPASTKAKKLYELAGKNDIFILIHGGKTPFYNGERSMLACFNNFVSVLDEFKHVKFVFAHMGKYFDPFAKVFEIMRNHDNLLVDISGIDMGTIYEGLCKLGPEKILFGSDWPYGSQIGALNILEKAINKYCQSFQIDKEIVYRQILWSNAKYLLSLDM